MSHPTIEYTRERLSREEMIAAARQFLETIRKRRTVREFSRDPSRRRRSAR